MAKKPKIYLSAAAHATDNATKCPGKCSENTHCIAYMDRLAQRLKALGFAVKQGSAKLTGEKAMRARVKEANKWGAKLYYVAHTNSGGGRYSMTMCWPDAASRAKAEVLHKHRKCVASHKVVTEKGLYELSATAMTCLYDELFFHDNAEDCAWFHGGGMEQLVEETAQAFCELCGVTYMAPVAEPPKDKPADGDAPAAGDTILLKKGKLYLASTGSASVTRTGTFYLYDGKRVNGRYRVTNKKARVGKTPLALNVSGWVKL